MSPLTSTPIPATAPWSKGAAIAAKLATLPDDGPNGGYFDDAGVVPW